jgi:hypothetical protein
MSLSNADILKLAQAWIELYQLPDTSESRGRLFWAYEQLENLVRHDPEDAWHVIQCIRKLDGSDVIISNLAAGPLEDILVAYGTNLIERIEILAKEDPQLCRLLGGVWQNAIPESVWLRIKRIVQERFGST